MSRHSAKTFLNDNKFVLIVLCLLFAERVAVMLSLGVDYNLNNDDMGYFNSGIVFAGTGTISIYSPYPSAMVMPGMAVLLGSLSALFGDGLAYWLSIKLLWSFFGVCTAFFVYKAIRIFAQESCALIVSLAFFAPNLAWMDNLVLTETPYFLFLTGAVFCTLKMGTCDEKKYFVLYVVFYLLALSFRAIAVSLPLFSFIYLMIMKRPRGLVLRRMACTVTALLLFIVPWTVRNYYYFDAFIPLTYGAGNGVLLGTYQGYGYPADEELDYNTNVEQVFRERYASYLDENGNAKDPIQQQYLALEKDGIKAEYRQRVWADTHPFLMSLSYLVKKPLSMSIMVFYWTEVLGVSRQPLVLLRFIDLMFCCLTFVLAFVYKKHRATIGYLAAAYWVNIYLISLSLSFDRYAETLMSLRYIIVGIGISILAEIIKQRMKKSDPMQTD